MSRGAAYETVVGLEVHVQLSTRTKMFCGCANEFGAPQNTNVCPVCLGMPGVLPVINREAIERAIRASLAVGCEVKPRTKFDRKSYYYPDLPKNYQISQYDEPLGRAGSVEFGLDGETRRVRVRRLHMEEDAGKLVHSSGGGASSVDLNRAGVPLMEIVSEPDMRSGPEARAYLEELRGILRYIGVSECNMEEGSMRCEPNISIRPEGSGALGTKTEVKNLNSFRAVEDAVDYEAERHARLIDSGDTVRQETMLWDPDRGETRPMRSKEEEQDYRYFPEPDLPPIDIPPEWLEEVRASVGELPGPRRARYAKEYGLGEYDIGVLTAQKEIADYFEAVVREGVEPKPAANWVTQDVLRLLGERKISIGELGVAPAQIAGLVALINERVIDRSIARDTVFPKMVETGRDAREIVESMGLAMVSDTSELESIARKVIDENPKPLGDVAKNPRAAMRYVGLVRKASGGRADAKAVIEVIAKLVKEKTGVDVEM
ncbi:MAG: Asp-tRNA(Asn)/Glu-tRNA(Gln) amidotransferase subunit GatB [Planctomycetota bacterium]